MLKFITMLLTTSSLWAHGMNEAGPHQGEIRMIGTFHTELVLLKKEIQVYLLDIGFKNPTTKDSNVELSLTSKSDNQFKISCIKRKDYFYCPINFKISDIKSVEIKATRIKNSPNEVAFYQFPLSFYPH